MKAKYKLKTGDTLKCAACGNNEFEEKKRDIGAMSALPSREFWEYLCGACSHTMAFVLKLQKQSQ